MKAKFTTANMAALNGALNSNYALTDVTIESEEINKNVSKALSPDAQAGTIGYNVDPSTMLGQFTTPLRVELLDADIKRLTFGPEQFVFFNKLTKLPSAGTVQQYLTYDRHGEIGHSMAVGEGQIAKISAQQYSRHTVNMKYLSTSRQVTFQAGMTASVLDPIQGATDDAITSLAAEIEWMSFYGDKSLSKDNVEGNEFDGLRKQIPAENVIDLKGAPLQESDINKAAVLISKAYGYPTDAFLPIGAKTLLVNNLLERQRLLNTSAPQDATIGFNAPRMATPAGVVSLNGSSLMENYNILDENDPYVSGIDPKVVATIDTNATNGQFADTDVHALVYKVVSVSGDKHSQAIEADVQLDNKTHAVNLAVTIPQAFDAPVEYVRVFRQASESGLFYEIGKVTAANAVDGVVTFVDTNAEIPGTVDAYVGQMTSDVIGLYQMLPIMRFQLATLAASHNWSFLWFGALVLFNAHRWVRIKNIATIQVKPQR